MDGEKLNQMWADVCAQGEELQQHRPFADQRFLLPPATAGHERGLPHAHRRQRLHQNVDRTPLRGLHHTRSRVIERHYVDFIKQALLDLHHVPFTVVIEVDITAPGAQGAQPAAAAPNQAGEDGRAALGDEPAAWGAQPAQDHAPAGRTGGGAAAAEGALPPAAYSAASIALQEDRGVQAGGPFADAEGLSSAFTFENFVIGDSNRMAYSMAVAVAEMPGKRI